MHVLLINNDGKNFWHEFKLHINQKNTKLIWLFLLKTSVWKTERNSQQIGKIVLTTDTNQMNRRVSYQVN